MTDATASPDHGADDGLLPAQLAAVLGNDYVIHGELPAGGMGRVFRATQTSLHRSVVVKVVANATRGVDVRRFQHEIQLSASLQHPHIVPVHFAGEVNGAPFFVMPYVDGISLRTLMDQRTALRSAELTRILRDIMSALQYAHTRNIVHRDLKPANVMLQSGSVVVLDFGVAKALAGDIRPHDTITAHGFTVGTPGYMAPEQVANDPALDHRADLYSFGVLAFELCAGQPLFRGSPSEILRQHLAADPPDLATLRTDLPRHVTETVRACLQKSPDDRPANAGAVLDMLDDIVKAANMNNAGSDTDRATAARTHGPSSQSLWWSPAVWIPAVYAIAAGVLVMYLLQLVEANQVREGIVTAAIVGALLGLPIALASGVVLRVFGTERAGRPPH